MTARTRRAPGTHAAVSSSMLATEHVLPVSRVCPVSARSQTACPQVRLATIRITDLQRELNVAAAAASHVGALQDHCHRLSRQLLQVCDAPEAPMSCLHQGPLFACSVYPSSAAPSNSIATWCAALLNGIEAMLPFLWHARIVPSNRHHGRRQEQGKVAALSAELETPLNVHRWRKLEGTDPAVYEALLKIQVRRPGRLAIPATQQRRVASLHVCEPAGPPVRVP